MPSKIRIYLCLLMLLVLPASADKLAVLEILSHSEDVGLTIHETRFLTDELRRRMIFSLPKENVVYTREQILSLIPENVEDLSTALSIGRAIKSDFVTQGTIAKLGGSYVLTIELYDCESGIMLGDVVRAAPDVDGLIRIIGDNSQKLAKIMTDKKLLDEGEDINLQSIPNGINDSDMLPKHTIVALGLDFLGVAMLSFGIYQNSSANTLYRKSQGFVNDANAGNINLNNPGEYEAKKNEFDKAYSDMKNAESARNIGFVVGSLLLAGGIAIHVWF